MDKGTLNPQLSPTVGPTCYARLERRHAPISVETLLFDEEQIVDFLQSVAHARALERHIKVVWKDYNESTVINVIYSILPFGKPGIVEVDTGDINQILAETKVEAQKLQELFLAKVSCGAKAIVLFLNAQQGIRQNCLETVQAANRDVSELNEGMRLEAGKAVTRLAVIKAASTITLKAAALGVGGLPAFLMTTGYDLTLNVIKDWEKAPNAKLVGLTSKFAEKTVKKGIKDAAKNMAYILKAEAESPERKAGWLSKRVAAMEEELTRRATAESLKKFNRDVRRLARAEQDAARARWGATALSSVKYVFFAWDVYSAIQDARETIDRGH